MHGFLEAGYLVGGLDVVPVLDNDTALNAAASRNEFYFRQSDVSKEAEASEAVKEIMQAFRCSAVSALVNNAALANPHLGGESLQERLSSWRNFIDVNLTGPFVMSEVVIPCMLPGSSIVHISSTRAHQSEPGTEGYGASKAGLCGLTHCQAVSLGSKGIRVNCILPGWIDTGGYPISEEDATFHTVGRVGQPSDITGMALYLTNSKLSGFVTGQEFVIDGGVSKKMVYPS